MVPQALLALYSYNSTSGIIVDIGERMEILPIYDGWFFLLSILPHFVIIVNFFITCM